MKIINSRGDMCDEIDQTLYSRRVIKASDTHIDFFSGCLGQFDRKGEQVLTWADTNIQTSSVLTHGEYVVRGIKFTEWKSDKKLREHLMGYGYFIFRVVDKDYLIYPIHLMSNYFFFLEKKLEIPIIIEAYYNFSVILNLEKEYGKECTLTCELLGKMRRVA